MEALIAYPATSDVVAVLLVLGYLSLCLPVLKVIREVGRVKAIILANHDRLLNIDLIRGIVDLDCRLLCVIRNVNNGGKALLIGGGLDGSVKLLDFLQEVYIIYAHHLSCFL